MNISGPKIFAMYTEIYAKDGVVNNFINKAKHCFNLIELHFGT